MKKELRQRALATRNALEKREEKSRQIAAHILESAAYQNTERIFTFVSMGSEVETEEIIRQAWQDGKAVAVPKTEKHREMHFYEIRSLAELSEGRFGVREPKGGVVCIPKEGDLLLVPGLLFDGKKNRLGYGGVAMQAAVIMIPILRSIRKENESGLRLRRSVSRRNCRRRKQMCR